jgi:hypothetical protein
MSCIRQIYKFLNVKAIPLQAWTGPEGSRSSRLPEFLDNRRIKLVKSALGIDRLHPQEKFLLLISVKPRSHVPVFNRSGADRTGESTTWNFKTSPVLTGRSNDQERCDHAVVRTQWSAVDRNSISALFFLYRRRKRRRNRLHWVHPEI